MLLLQNRFEVKKGILVISLPWCCKCLHRCSQHPLGGGGLAAHHHEEGFHFQMKKQEAPQDDAGKTKILYVATYLFMHPRNTAETLPGEEQPIDRPTNMDQRMDNYTKPQAALQHLPRSQPHRAQRGKVSRTTFQVHAKIIQSFRSLLYKP